MKFLGAKDMIPTQAWRLGVFAMPSAAVIGLTEDEIKNAIAFRVTRGGMDISLVSIKPLSIWISIYGGAAQCWGAWVSNTVQGMTTSQFYQRTALPAQFSSKAAAGEIEWYLDVFQGAWAGDVYLAETKIWSTMNSILKVGVWYQGVAVWKKGDVPSATILNQKLKAAGYDLWSREGGVVPFYYEGQPNGLVFMLYSGAKTTTPADIAKVIGADIVMVNLAEPLDDPMLTKADNLAELGDAMLSSLSDLGAGLAEATGDVSEGTGNIVEVLGFVGKWFLPIVIVGGGAYLYYRSRRKKKWDRSYGDNW